MRTGKGILLFTNASFCLHSSLYSMRRSFWHPGACWLHRFNIRTLCKFCCKRSLYCWRQWCVLNGPLARDPGVSYIRCFSNRMAVWLARSQLSWTKCKALKSGATLRKKTSIKPQLLQATRWSGKFTMLQRIETHIQSIARKIPASWITVERIKTLGDIFPTVNEMEVIDTSLIYIYICIEATRC